MLCDGCAEEYEALHPRHGQWLCEQCVDTWDPMACECPDCREWVRDYLADHQHDLRMGN